MESVNKGYGKIGTGWNDIKECYVKQNGLWVKHPSVYVKRNDDWYKITFAQLPPGVICVSPFGSGDGMGSNWSNAMSFVNFRVLARITPGNTYFLKKGCYAIDANIPTTGDFENYIYKGTPKCLSGGYPTSEYYDRTVKLPPNTSIYGGFEGNDAEPMKRYGMFDGIENRTLFFMQKRTYGIGNLFTILKNNSDMSSNFITLDNIDIRIYTGTSQLIGIRYINDDGEHPTSDASGLHITLSRITSNCAINCLSLQQVMPEGEGVLPNRCSVTFDSCMIHSTNESMLGSLSYTSINASLITKNCMFIGYPNYAGNGGGLFGYSRINVGHLDTIQVKHINDTVICRKYDCSAHGNGGYYYTNPGTGQKDKRPDIINCIWVRMDPTNMANLLYKNGDYTARAGTYPNEYRDNYLNTLCFYPGTTSIGSPGNYNTLGLVYNRDIADYASALTVTAFFSNDDYLVKIAGYSDAIVSPNGYAPGVSLGDCNASVPNFDITGYPRPSGVMTLGAWHYR